MNTSISNYKLTFLAIRDVRNELAHHDKAGDNAKANECLARLSELYASIDADHFIDCMNELETCNGISKVNFNQKKVS